jgi:hypothetical protein
MLRMLQNGVGTEGFDEGGDMFRLMSDDHDGFLRAQRSAGAQDLFDKSAASCPVQDLGEAGLEARAFSGSKNDNGEIVRWHGLEIHFAGGLRISQCGDFGGEAKG